tara:strand:+ start:142 stop:528 length:387 start_codon:yes stop_codon:yes gene_type:complete
MPEWTHLREQSTAKKRSGRYHGSFFSDIPSYGKSRWVVLGEIDVDFSVCTEKDMSEREVVEACVNYLNLPPPRKKYAKREPKPPYGTLELYKYYVKEQNNATNKTRVQVLLITDQRKNKNFWREGMSR